EKLIFKLLRRLDEGQSPALQLGRFLLEGAFAGTPRLTAAIEYVSGRQPPMTLGVVHDYVHHQVDAAVYTRAELRRFFERVAARRDWGALPKDRPLADLLDESSPGPAVTNVIGAYLEAARLMGKRTAELHLALTGATPDSEFYPETYSTLYQRSAY